MENTFEADMSNSKGTDCAIAPQHRGRQSSDHDVRACRQLHGRLDAHSQAVPGSLDGRRLGDESLLPDGRDGSVEDVARAADKRLCQVTARQPGVDSARGREVGVAEEEAQLDKLILSLESRRGDIEKQRSACRVPHCSLAEQERVRTFELDLPVSSHGCSKQPHDRHAEVLTDGKLELELQGQVVDAALGQRRLLHGEGGDGAGRGGRESRASGRDDRKVLDLCEAVCDRLIDGDLKVLGRALRRVDEGVTDADAGLDESLIRRRAHESSDLEAACEGAEPEIALEQQHDRRVLVGDLRAFSKTRQADARDLIDFLNLTRCFQPGHVDGSLVVGGDKYALCGGGSWEIVQLEGQDNSLRGRDCLWESQGEGKIVLVPYCRRRRCRRSSLQFDWKGQTGVVGAPGHSGYDDLKSSRHVEVGREGDRDLVHLSRHCRLVPGNQVAETRLLVVS
eukprot:764153-Hanusia_phi.AAC.11